MASDRTIRIAVAADLHFDGSAPGTLRDFFGLACEEADILALCGDFTTHGEPAQVRGFVEEMDGVDIPVVGVLGNHDHEAEKVGEGMAILRDRGMHILDGTNVVIEGVGFAGVKGFGGGFGRGMLGPFGEPLYKQFVQAAVDEALKLERALRSLDAPTRIALLHYAPIADTLAGEPEVIFPFLGSSRLLPPLETYGADVVFHGHAHIGWPEGKTPSGIPVYNVAAALLEKHTGKPYRIWTASAPDRREGDSAKARVHSISDARSDED